MSKTSSTNKSRKSAPPIGEKSKGPSKIEILSMLLRQPQGANLAELATATGWQNHSVRGALAGTLKKKGHVVSSELVDGTRRYRIAEAQA